MALFNIDLENNAYGYSTKSTRKENWKKKWGALTSKDVLKVK